MEFGKFLRRRIRKLKGVKPELLRVEDVTRSKQDSWAIPPVVYQTGRSRLVHPFHWNAISQFRDINSELSFEFFDDEAVGQYMRKQWGAHPIFKVFEDCLFPQMRADIFRYCVVYDRGGYYLDINKTVEKPLREFHSSNDQFLISFESNNGIYFPDSGVAGKLQYPEKVVLQWAFGASPNHPVLSNAIDRIIHSAPFFRGKVFSNVRDAVVMFTGPGVFTQAIWSELSHGESSEFAQAGIDFDGTGVFRVKGSNLSSTGETHYSSVQDSRILSD